MKAIRSPDKQIWQKCQNGTLIIESVIKIENVERLQHTAFYFHY